MNEDVITIGDKSRAKRQMIWFHGYGANNWSFEPTMKLLNLNLDEKLYIIMPNAPVMGDKRSWYPLPQEINGEVIEDDVGIDLSKDMFCDAIQKFINPSEKIILGGFSQGAAFSMYIGLNNFIPCSHIISIGGYIPSAKKINFSSNNKKVYISHGRNDTTISIDTHRKSVECLEKNNQDYHEFIDDCGHTISKPMIDDLTDWIYKIT